MRSGFEEFLGLGLGVKTDYTLDPGTVVPAAIEQHDLALRRKVGDVALEIPRVLVALARRTKRHDPRVARAHMLDDALYGPVFAGGVAALEDDEGALAMLNQVPLELHELDLEPDEMPLIAVMAQGSG